MALKEDSCLVNVMGWIVPPKRYAEFIIPNICECDLISKFADVNNLRWGHTGVGLALSSTWMLFL